MMDDDIYVDRLRAAVRVDELTSSLDARAVLSQAQRTKTRANVVRSTGALAVTAALVVAGAQAVGSWDVPGGPIGPAAQEGTADVPALVDIAPGVRATIRPAVRVLADGTRALVLGLTASNHLSSDATELAVVPNDGANHHARSSAPWRDDAQEIALLAGDTVAQRQYWDTWGSHAPLTAGERVYWTRGGAPEPEPLDPNFSQGRPRALGPNEGWAMASPFDDGTWLIVGYVPAGTDPDHLARVTLREPIPGGGNAEMSTLELPTFDAGSADGRRMFAATIGPEIDVPTPDDGATFVLERVPVDVVPGPGTD